LGTKTKDWKTTKEMGVKTNRTSFSRGDRG